MQGNLESLGFLGILLLACLAFIVEKNYTQRWTVVANAFIIITIFGINIFTTEPIISIWIIGSIIAAIVAALSYIYTKSLPRFIHEIFFLFYSSKTVLGIVLAMTLGHLFLIIIFIPLIWYISCRYLGHRFPFLQ